MFDEEQINAYKNIKAPERIYKRLNKKNYSFLAIVACLVCVIMLSVFFKPVDTKITVKGQIIENTVVATDNKLRSTDIEIPFELDIKEKTEITVSKGQILFNEKEETTVTIKDGGSFVWIVKNDDVPCEISISDKKGVKSFTLIYENSQYILRRNEK